MSAVYDYSGPQRIALRLARALNDWAERSAQDRAARRRLRLAARRRARERALEAAVRPHNPAAHYEQLRDQASRASFFGPPRS